MRTIKVGFNTLGRATRLFFVWVEAMVAIGIIAALIYQSWISLALLIILFVVWAALISSSSYTMGRDEIQKRAIDMAKSNGHNKRNLIMIFDEKKKDTGDNP